MIDQGLNGINPLSYLGVNARSPVNFVVRTNDPTSTDNRNVSIGDMWLNRDNNRIYQLTNIEGGVANWLGIAYFLTQTRNPTSGDYIYPLGTMWLNTNTDNIYQLIAVNGTSATWVLMMDSTGPLLQITTEDSNVVTPSGGNINVIGSGNIVTTGSGSTVTVTSSQAQLLSNYTLVNTTPYIVLSTDYYLGVDSSGGAITVQLPNAPTANRIFIIKDITGSSATHNITVTTVGGVVTIDGSTSFVMNTNYESANFAFAGSSYQVY